MAKPPRHTTIPRLAVAAVTLTSGAVMPAVGSPVQDAYLAHSRACIGLFLSDPAAHAAQCLPNNSPNIPAHSGSSTATVPPAPAIVVAPPPPPPPPPVVVPDPIVESSYPEVGSSYPEVDSSYPEVDSSYPEVDSSYPEVDSSYPEA
jgi:hypothetical protein